MRTGLRSARLCATQSVAATGSMVSNRDAFSPAASATSRRRLVSSGGWRKWMATCLPPALSSKAAQAVSSASRLSPRNAARWRAVCSSHASLATVVGEFMWNKFALRNPALNDYLDGCDHRNPQFCRSGHPRSCLPQRLAGGPARPGGALSTRAVGWPSQTRRNGAFLAVAPRHVPRVVDSDRADRRAFPCRQASAAGVRAPVRAATAVHARPAQRPPSDRGPPLLPDLPRG